MFNAFSLFEGLTLVFEQITPFVAMLLDILHVNVIGDFTEQLLTHIKRIRYLKHTSATSMS